MGIFGQSQAGQPRNDGELHNLQVTEAVFGTCLPILFGTRRLHAKLLFYGGFYATKAPNSGGKGIFGGKATQFDYFADVISALCQGSATGGLLGLLNIWDQNGKLQNEYGSYVYTVPSGGGSVAPATGAPIQHDLGATKAMAYSVVANDYGGPGPVTLAGTQQFAMGKVAASPGAGQYAFDASTGTYTFSAADAGAEVSLSWSSAFSLYYFVQVQAAEIPATAPYQVSTDNESYFYSDGGVYFVDTAEPGVEVGTPSAAGQYNCNRSTGVYTFWSGDAGRFVYITYTYTSSDPDITNSSSLNLTLFNGAQSQSPSSYMTSKYPSAAFGYTGICYALANPLALGESAALPSYNYEIVGLATFGGGNVDALPTACMELLLTDPLIGVGFPSANLDLAGTWVTAAAYHASNGFFISDALDTQTPAAQAMQRWLDVGNLAAVWSGGLLKLVPYGDTTTVGNGYTYTPPTTPAFALTWDDLLPWTEAKTGQTIQDDPIQISVKAAQDCMNYVQCQYTNRLNDYNNELIVEQNDAFMELYGVRQESSQTWDFISTLQAATWALNLRLKRNCYIRNGYKLKLPFWFSALEPMDLLVLPTGENVRVLQVEDDPNGVLTVSAEQWSYGTNDVTIYPKQPPQSYQPNVSQGIPGDTVPVFVQKTSTQASGVLNSVQISGIGQNANWGGCKVYVSNDGETYVPIGSITSSGIIGHLSAALPSATGTDTTDTLSVDITLSQLGDPGAELVTVTSAQAANLTTLCAIVNYPGNEAPELISYQTATLTGPGRYNLTTLRRGALGTVPVSHPVGAIFAFLGPSPDFLDYQYVPQYVGQSLYVKLCSFNLAGNQQQSLSQVIAWPLFVLGLGSNGAVDYSPSATEGNITDNGGTIENVANAYDGTFSTYATMNCPGGYAAGTLQVATAYYFGFPDTTLPVKSTLKVSYSYEGNCPSGNTEGFIVSIQAAYSETSANILLVNNSVVPLSGAGIAELIIPPGVELATVSVATSCACGSSGGTDSGATATLDIFEIWIEV